MGGFPGWVAAGGETEPVTEATTNAGAQPNTNTQPAGVPTNPTTNDSKTPATVAPKNADGATAQPAGATTQVPTKTTKSKKSKHRRTKPSSD